MYAEAIISLVVECAIQLRPGTMRVSVGAGCLLRASQEIPGMSGGHMGQLRAGTLRVSVGDIPGNSWWTHGTT